ncbi:MAG: pilus assembly protein [Lachnospiraceae bacterium]|nr:pilus assembly protein [Lachnospiraceae bacterium]
MKVKELKASATIEMAYIVPITLFIIMAIIFIVFYFHDKNILIGAAAETAVIGTQVERRKDIKGTVDLEDVFAGRVENKLIIFPNHQVRVEQSRKEITVYVSAEKGWLQLHIKQGAYKMEPEASIRRVKVWGDAAKDFFKGDKIEFGEEVQ